MTKETVVHAGGVPPTLRQVLREIAEVLAAVPIFVVAPLLRHWHRRWGATDYEVEDPMLGDHLLPGCQSTITRAITIDAPPEAVWPWLAQAGFGKAGFYSYDLLDNVAHPSADYLREDLQDVRVGDWVPMFAKVNPMTAFKVADVEPGRRLLWVKPDSTWEWQLTAMGMSTRLVTRLRIQYRWRRAAESLFSLMLNELADFPMMRRMLRNIKRRAEHPGTLLLKTITLPESFASGRM